MKSCLTILILFTFLCYGQSQLVIDRDASILGISVSDQMSYFEDESATLSPEEFLRKKSTLKELKMTSKLQNFDFTNSSFFIHFALDNQSGEDQRLILETARPVTNRVNLFCVETGKTAYSGDGTPFKMKSVPTNFSALSIFVPAGENREYVLHLTSDGENLTVPMTFYGKKEFISMDSDRQLYMGIFMGIFLFVIVIYFSFYVLLNESLFLLYVIYAFFSGVMQLSLDGYLHEFVFRSGGYFTHHIQLMLSSATVIVGMFYAMGYLAVSGRMKKTGIVIIVCVAITMILSFFPGTLYELAYLLNNGVSFVALVFMIGAAVIQRRRSKEEVSQLFLIGLSFVGVGGLLFILGNFGLIDAPMITLNALKSGTMIEMVFLSILMAKRYKELQQERELAQRQLLLELKEKNRAAIERNERLEIEVTERTRQIEAQRIALKEKNQDFKSSVMYAKRIQSAVLSNEEKFKNLIPDSMIFLKPKDVVSGDFYWVDQLSNESEGDQLAYVTADCTGHGVPGALVSIIGNHLLDEGNLSNGFADPGLALDELNVAMNTALNSRYASEKIRDGMDLTLCVLDKKRRILKFSGARNSAYIVRKGELIELKGDRKPIGFNREEETHQFQSQTIQLEIGDMIYTCSDGYADQFGGPKGKKFMSKRLKSLFIEIATLSLDDQRTKLNKTLNEWMGTYEQLDDILVIGIQVTA